jgi:hypothetical protein
LFAATVNLLGTIGMATTLVAPVLALMCCGIMQPGLPPEATAMEGTPGSGIVLRTEITAVWIPRDLCDQTRRKVGVLANRSPKALQTCVGRNEWGDAWYALTYRGHQVDGRFAEITQIRPLREAVDHLEELQAVTATASGKSLPFRGADFSNARVEVIPETLQAADPREAITHLMAEPFVGDKSPPRIGQDSM